MIYFHVYYRGHVYVRKSPDCASARTAAIDATGGDCVPTKKNNAAVRVVRRTVDVWAETKHESIHYFDY